MPWFYEFLAGFFRIAIRWGIPATLLSVLLGGIASVDCFIHGYPVWSGLITFGISAGMFLIAAVIYGIGQIGRVK